MKKFWILLFIHCLLSMPAYARSDSSSANYLRNRKHFAVMNPAAQGITETVIKKALKKETGANFKVKFKAYTLSSLKKGIFKYLEIEGQDINIEQVELPYVHLKTLSDYNWIDYNHDPVIMKSDMEFAYDVNLSEKSLNDALKKDEYQKIIENVNQKAYPLFIIKNIRAAIRYNKVYIIMTYNFPITPSKNDKTFVVASGFRVEDGKIYAENVSVDKAYGRVSLEKVTNLINMLDPLTFTLDLVDSQKCNAKIEKLNIVDNIIQVNGKILVKGEQK